MKKIIYLTIHVSLFIFCFQNLLHAQEKKSFTDVAIEKEKKFSKPINLMTVEEKNEFRKYKQYIDYWSRVMPPQGNIEDYYSMQSKYCKGYQSITRLKSTSNGLNWIEIGPTKMPVGTNIESKGVGRIDHIAFDPNNSQKMLVCSPGGGLFRSIDGGDTWINAGTDKELPRTGISCSVIDSFDSENTWYIATGAADITFWGVIQIQDSYGIYRTKNGGVTWESIGLSAPLDAHVSPWRFHINNILQIPGSGNRGYLIAATTDGIYKTTNALNSTPAIWTRLIAGCFMDVQLKPGTSNLIYCSTQAEKNPKVYEYNLSTNQQRILITLAPNNPDNPNNELVRVTLRFSNANPNQLYIVYLDDQDNSKYSKLLRYDLTKIDPPVEKGKILLRGGRPDPIFVSQSNANIIYFGDVNPIYKSSNGLDNNSCVWTSLGNNKVHADIHYITMNPEGDELWAATDGGLYVSTDDGVTFTEKNVGLGIGQVYGFDISEINSNVIISGYQDVGTHVLRKNTSGTWDVSHVLGSDGYHPLIDYSDPSIMYAQIQNTCMYRSENAGVSFNSFAGNPDFLYILNSKDHNVLYATDASGVYKSSFRGNNSTWESVWASFPGGLLPNAWGISTSPTNSNYLYVSLYKALRIVKSTTGGGPNSTDWVVLGNSPSAPTVAWSAGEIDYYNPDHIWVIGGWPGYVYSVDTKTDTWTQITRTGIDPNAVLGQVVSEYNSNYGLYLSSSVGIYYRDASMDSWIDITGNLPNTNIHMMKINHSSKEIIVGTYGRGIWSAPLYCASQSHDLTVTGTISNQYKQAEHNITSNALVQNKVMFRAGNEIVLNPNFETSTGSDFVAYINECNDEGILKSSSKQGNNNSYELENDKNLENPVFENLNKNVSIFPNPNSGIFEIKLKNLEGLGILRIYDLMGSLVKQVEFTQNSLQFNFSELSKGIYFLNIQTSEELFTEKVIIE